MLAALRLVLFDDHDFTRTWALTPIVTWLVIVGGVASGVRFVWTVAKLLYKGFRAATDQAP